MLNKRGYGLIKTRARFMIRKTLALTTFKHLINFVETVDYLCKEGTGSAEDRNWTA